MGCNSSKKVSKIPASHINCRSNDKDASKSYMHVLSRAYVPDDKVKWNINFDEYSAPNFTTPVVLNSPEWADSVNPWNIFNWNKVTEVDRTSYMGVYDVVHGRPINPVGRTGIKGRGRLGKWGPNHAADPIVTRWKLDDKGKKVNDPVTKKPILQFVAIERSDTKEWAIPGGMCDIGEHVSKTLKREFLEEAVDSTNPKEIAKANEIEKKMENLFKKGVEVYKGYVDDPRNTDNAWMETVVYGFHDGKNNVFKNFDLKAGDDADNVKWMDIDGDIELYANHKDFIEKIAIKYKAHWKPEEKKSKKSKK